MKTAKKQPVPPITDEEEAKIQAGIALDPDNPEWTDEDFARARPAKDVLPPQLYEALVRNSRQRQKEEAGRKLVSLRLDVEVVEKFRASGPGWQGRINDVLRKAVGLGKGR
jgi:uncharacterized protein (DUF4415 family)